MNRDAVARRYAVALMDSVDESAWTRTGEDLETACRRLTTPPVWDVIKNPTVATESKQKLLRRLVAEDGPVLRLLAVMVKNRREELLPAVAPQFEAVLLDRRGLVAASIRTARALDTAEQARLEELLRLRLGRSVRAAYSVDPSLLGGVEVRLWDRLWDGTLRGRLDRLQAQLKREVGTGEA
jgi:F-type H+-transporting ATPase subunit delta